MGSFIPPGQHSLPATGPPPAAFRSLLCRPREPERDTKKKKFVYCSALVLACAETGARMRWVACLPLRLASASLAS